MTNVPASIVQIILLEVRIPDAVLLRGANSILRGEPQNDIDLFVPPASWPSSSPFGPHEVVSDNPKGAHQRKVLVRVAETGNIVEIDVFHQLTWRGIQMIDAMSLPTRKIDGIETKCLALDAEAWLTVVKNVLHGSMTPERKLAEMNGSPMLRVTNSQSGWLRRRLYAALTAAAWEAATEQSVRLTNVWSARVALVLLRLSDAPVTTVSSFFGWLVWRVFSRIVGR